MHNLLLVALVSLPPTLAGPGDTVEDLKHAYSNVPISEQALHAKVVTVEGNVPDWIEGSLVRHACGVFGETESTSENLDRVDHLFDCINTVQSYGFHNGMVSFSNQFYDTNQVYIWKWYEEDMSQSSIYWGRVYGKENVTAKEHEKEAMNNPYKPSNTPAVSWWRLGNKVLGMSEHIAGAQVDVHNAKYLADFRINTTAFNGWKPIHMPAHEQYGPDGTLYNVVAMVKTDDSIPYMLKSKRVIIAIDPVTEETTTLGEYSYEDADVRLCSQNEITMYPDINARVPYIHSFAMTKEYIIIPETAYRFNPCSLIYDDPTQGRYAQAYTYEPTDYSRVYVMSLLDNKMIEGGPILIQPMFTTHMLGAYQEDGLLHFDLLQYNDQSIYTEYTYVSEAIKGQGYPAEYTKVMRYTLDTATTPWSVKFVQNLLKTTAVEFSTINPAYQGIYYNYAYMVENPFQRHGAVLKLNVQTGEVVRVEMPDGHFPTEPIFIPSPSATAEDDGVLVMGGINGRASLGFVMVFNATNMEIIYHGSAPHLTLFGLHAKFFPFSVGCETHDCTPNPN